MADLTDPSPWAGIAIVAGAVGLKEIASAWIRHRQKLDTVSQADRREDALTARQILREELAAMRAEQAESDRRERESHARIIDLYAAHQKCEAEVNALRNVVDELRREVADLRTKVSAKVGA